MGYKERIDAQVSDRAPWIDRPGWHMDAIRSVLRWALSYHRCLRLTEEIGHYSCKDMMDRMGRDQASLAEITGLENIPPSGGAMIVVNHPTGIADGVALWRLLTPLRPDIFFFANSDISTVVPPLEPMIAPVEWREDRRSREKARATLVFTREAMQAGRLGIIFPSGRLAKRRGLQLYERPWMPSASALARKFDVPLIPVNIQARNSTMFYLFDLIHPSLRDITLFHEMLNKERQPFQVTVGTPISPKDLPSDNDEAILMLREKTLGLGGRHAPAISLWDATPRPKWLARILGPA